MLKIKSSPMDKRLTPLYVAALLQGIPFWYAIEKLFMLEIGFNTASIGFMVAIMSIVMLVVETPSGVLADRWSRKGVMILGAVSLMISAIIGAISYNETIFIISTIFWGTYAALYTGTYDSVIYDAEIEEHGNAKNFQKYLGRFRAVEGISFVIGSLVGGMISSLINMRATFFISIPFIILSIYFLHKFKEPKIHKSEVTDPVFKHIAQTFASVLKKPILLPVIVATVGFAVLTEIVFELSQLWFIAVAAPLALYGVFSALIFSSWSFGGMLAAQTKTKTKTYLMLLFVLISVTLLIFSRNYWLILATQFIFAVSLIALSVVLDKKLHDELPSKVRAGSASVVGTISRIIIIPGSIIFTRVANNSTVFNASYILLALAAVSVIGFLAIPHYEKKHS